MRFLVLLVCVACSTVPADVGVADECELALRADPHPEYFIENRSVTPARLEIFDHRPPDDPEAFRAEMAERLRQPLTPPRFLAAEASTSRCYVQRQGAPNVWACVERSPGSDLQFWPSSRVLRQHLAVDPMDPNNRLVFLCMGR